MRSRKTPAQQQAWGELLLLINDPEWYLDREKSDRHKTLMKIILADDKDDSSKSKKRKISGLFEQTSRDGEENS
ncbi:hypothetical protein J9537_00890 [Enterococcus raffinosus]|uniref:hypothetical protein n=1 Tax=Enterococcus raffinosus TaxID=71452 RepID=UPI001C46F238|nr:hypothetical protein [Enterococcus raffinosus]QXJ59378.1 hypothetical protein J9537_00890 [Enterococcus raffinosus]